MILNASLLCLTVSSLSRAPFVAHGAMMEAAQLGLLRIRASRSLSHFLFVSGVCRSCFVSSSLFRAFLESPIVLSSFELNGFSHQMSPVITSSFTCNNSVFRNNSTPDVGAAIRVETFEEIIGTINGSEFTGNSASFGGAIFFSAQGKLVADSTEFSWNDAIAGGHLLIYLQSLRLLECKFSFGTGVSCIELNTFTEAIFDGCSFFKNPGTILVCGMSGTPVVFNDCCFMDYNDTGNFPSKYDFFDPKMFMLFLGTNYVNLKPVTSGSYSVEQLLSTLMHVSADSNPDANRCRLVPTPSVTLVVSFSLPAIALIATVAFFAVVSILGMIGVVFCHSARREEFLLTGKETLSSSHDQPATN